MLTIALIGAACFVSHVLADCSTSPIYLDIHAREVEDTSAPSYGAYINVGTPLQILSLWPALDLNETTLSDTDFCSSSSCSASNAHGLFDLSNSISWQTTTTISNLDNVSVLTGNVSTIAETGTDVLHLWEQFITGGAATETNISSFPLQLLTNYTSSKDPFFGPTGRVGLGRSSTVLDHLVKQGNIASRSYGLFLGSAYSRANGVQGVNGSLTLGGYDAARLQGPVNSFPLVDGSDTLKVHVSQMSLSKNSTGLLPRVSTDAFDAFLSTSQYELTLPTSLQAVFQSSLNSIAGPNSIGANSEFTIVLGSNLTVSFDGSWLATNPIKFSDNGPYILGAAFFSNVYLAVSHDSSPPTFYLAAAVQDAAFIGPVSLCENTAPVPQNSANISFFVKNGLIGLIIGATVGGSALAILAFVMLKSWRRRVERKQIVRFVNLKRQEAGGDVELGDVKLLKMKASQVHVVERMEKDKSMRRASWEGEPVMRFDPPPRRATVLGDKKERKMGLRGILKVKIPDQSSRP